MSQIPGNSTVEKGVIVSKEAQRCLGESSSGYKELWSQKDGEKLFPLFLFCLCPPITGSHIQIHLWEVHSNKKVNKTFFFSGPKIEKERPRKLIKRLE